MPHGRRTRRTLTKFAGILLALSLAAGCQRLTVAHLPDVPLPPSVPSPSRLETTVSSTAPLPDLPPGALVSAPMPRGTGRPGPIVTATTRRPAPSATPLLDAALRQAKNEQEPIAAPAGSSPAGDDPEARAGTNSALPKEPAPVPVTIPAGASTSVPASVEKVEEPGVATAPPILDRDTTTPDPAPKAIQADKPAGPSRPRDVWREGLDRLRSVARDRSEESGRGADPDVWLLRCQVLEWLDMPEHPAEADDAALLHNVLTALAGVTNHDGHAGTPAQLRSAVEALESRAPLEITELHLCRKVKGFGDFELLDAASCRSGHAMIVYCEVVGLHSEEEGSLFRSRLATRIEVLPSGGGEPVWTQEPATTDFTSRRRRRDNYLNFRVTLPESLAPGAYELRLTQDDLVARQSATRSIPLVISP